MAFAFRLSAVPVVHFAALCAIVGLGAASCSPADSGEGPRRGGSSGGTTSGTSSTGSGGGEGGSTGGGTSGSGGAGATGGTGVGGRGGGTAGSSGIGGGSGPGVGGAAGGGVAGSSGAGGAGGADAGRSDGAADAGAAQDGGGACTPGPGTNSKFSFFLTSMAGLLRLAGSQNGFGGDLRFGKSDGLAGADEICRQLAEAGHPGAGCKTWRAFLSVTKGPSGTPINAGDRVGSGPWYDRLDRLVAMTKDDLLQPRPRGADPVIINDLPNEYGVPNHNPDGLGFVDNHTTLTGTGPGGLLFSMDWGFTCHDWTSKVGTDGTPKIGFSWRGGAGAVSGSMWYTGQFNEAGCADYINITDAMGPSELNKRGVGSQGGYGGFYCLALEH